MTDLLTDPLIRAAPHGALSLPGVLAALARDEIASFPAMRPHQAPAWHMFLVQLAALALVAEDTDEIPTDEADWARLLRGLTTDFPEDEPWRLVVDDWTKPAFLQPPVPDGVKLSGEVATADALDLLITSRNHDLKQAIARAGAPEDWVFALVSLQTMEGYGGAGNHGIARMNGGSSSRPMLGLAPAQHLAGRAVEPRLGAHFGRDVEILLATRDDQLDDRWSHLDYPMEGGLGLSWLAPWPEGSQLKLSELDIWFIEVCRRVRLVSRDGTLSARRGTSKAQRIAAKPFNGAVGDPWAPTHKTEAKSFTLGEADFDYRTLSRLLFGEKGKKGHEANWEIPLLATPTEAEQDQDTLVLVAQALSRGNSKTDGFKSRVLPIRHRILRGFGSDDQRARLYELAQAQMADIEVFDLAIRNGLARMSAAGERELTKDDYAHAADARRRFANVVDAVFFEALWDRFEAQDASEAAVDAVGIAFARRLFERASALFEAELGAVPCASLFRWRAEARARADFDRTVRRTFPDLFPRQHRPEADDDVDSSAA
ncbi:type I-E CRISPR-associated protein Cse1/CasA [Amorphus sp. 3PC139-8]|uniref:type I-E CRISPR-associated protein Cse1/CasA n=1 Tax=Amorphus sp. 3PC139-8 TaxID=2735676 RepID=UPI00345D6F13